jgi:hypothetical protein
MAPVGNDSIPLKTRLSFSPAEGGLNHTYSETRTFLKISSRATWFPRYNYKCTYLINQFFHIYYYKNIFYDIHTDCPLVEKTKILIVS